MTECRKETHGTFETVEVTTHEKESVEVVREECLEQKIEEKVR